jgi:hypothetical protein
MTARRRALIVLIVLAVAGTAFAINRWRSPSLGPRPEAERPALLLLTSLPLMFSEDFSLKGSGSEALRRLQTRYTVVPISVSSEAELTKGRLLLMAQPLAQTAENLVALDDWVRAGGRVLLLADPMLEWPSKRPLGDVLRPPPMFADTGLLGHWGLRLDAPDQRGPAERKLGGYSVLTLTPGSLSGSCAIASHGLVADCRLGKGRAIVIADADFLRGEEREKATPHNLDGLLAELDQLERE